MITKVNSDERTHDNDNQVEEYISKIKQPGMGRPIEVFIVIEENARSYSERNTDKTNDDLRASENLRHGIHAVDWVGFKCSPAAINGLLEITNNGIWTFYADPF
jgi:hypothetical protein